MTFNKGGVMWPQTSQNYAGMLLIRLTTILL